MSEEETPIIEPAEEEETELVEDINDAIESEDRNAKTVATWYTYGGLGLAVLWLIFYLIFAKVDNPGMYGYELAMWVHQAIWWPVGILFTFMYFIEAEMLVWLFGLFTELTLAGPFLGYWVGFAMILVRASEYDLWGKFGTWLWMIIFAAYSIGSAIVQIIFLPDVRRYVDELRDTLTHEEEDSEEVDEEAEEEEPVEEEIEVTETRSTSGFVRL